ncbi:hypothetical protein V0R50_22545 [Pseudomonas sp. 148P]|uniref:Secreted protein n=1 Tax=Pseudomonas ulcerans TaxID=3115852 RepID=A0ABU7HWV2_9PSED|nr:MULTISPECIES: hypothetical protein [unclassified Pseudomonas]MEE1924601.1 hypothetical protein [Pseudomonas sp. 147P]MEE1936015.1 hypothetical protein [Pseudomonas sp. 148P]
MIRKIALVATLQLVLAPLAIAAGAAAGSSDLAGLKVAMDDRLKDAESARFKNVRIAKNGTTCGLVNAKNSYGAYAGFEPFLAMKLSSGKFYVVGLGEAAGQVCEKDGI